MKKYLYLIILQFIASSALAYDAHEWGTFTSLVGSNGKTQTGMYHEDEHLPDFVYGFGEVQPIISLPAPFPPFGECEQFIKTCFAPQVLQSNFISQKMETPVIYFYGEGGHNVKVDVDFPEGIITETFPAPLSSTPKNTEDLVIANGRAHFDVQLLPRSNPLTPPPVEPGNIYGHARETNSLMIKTNADVEKFIFYRGLGRFQPQFNISSVRKNLYINGFESTLPEHAFLVHVEENKEPTLLKVISPDGGLEPVQNSFGINYYTLSAKMIDQLKKGTGPHITKGDQATLTLVSALFDSGLFLDEAFAMVNTWKNGYFKNPGLRLLYILPRSEVDSILPLTLNPEAEELERAFVARVEIMLEEEELEIVSQSKTILIFMN